MRFYEKSPLVLIALSFFSCKRGGLDSSTKSLDDVERGSYQSEMCQAPQGSQLVFPREKIIVFGTACAASEADSLRKGACSAAEESLKTFSVSQQNLLSKLGMAVIINDGPAIDQLAADAYKSDALSTQNVSSFWITAKGKGNHYLASVVKVVKRNEVAKEVNYALIRTLGDFFARGTYLVRKLPGGAYEINPSNASSVPNEYLGAQARMSKNFLDKLSNKEANPLLTSIVGNNITLLSNFPVSADSLRADINAQNLANYITAEAVHQYHCNSAMRATFDRGQKYESLSDDLKLIRGSVDVIVASLLGEPISTQATDGLSLAGGGIFDFLQKLFTGVAANDSGSSQVASQTSKSDDRSPSVSDSNDAEDDSKIADSLVSCNCPNCTGSCSCGGGCSSCAGGGSCASGGACNCVGCMKAFSRG
jgi:hypothetical protein